jgi:hypothetical protein
MMMMMMMMMIIIIIIRVIGKWDGAWTGFIWLKTETGGG